MSLNLPFSPGLKGSDFVPVEDGSGIVHHTRFAPSPTGFLHLGHAYAALFAFECAARTGGTFRIRMEDVDRQRCRLEFEQAILLDLEWLGLGWAEPVVRQSERFDLYGLALAHLHEQDLAYPCFCSRKQIRAEIEQAGRAPHGPSGEVLYPGICRRLAPAERAARMRRGEPFAWRLDVQRALRRVGELTWFDYRAGWVTALPERLGDVVIGRKDAPVSYHLAVTVDDAAQGVTLVTRGEDLFHATHIHRLLQALLGLPAPRYYHHNLVADSTGQRLAKRNRAITLRHLRDSRRTPDEIWRMIGLGLATGGT